MKQSIKSRFKQWRFSTFEDGCNDYYPMCLMGETPIDALIKFYRRSHGRAEYHTNTRQIRLQFFPHCGRVRCNAEVYYQGKLSNVHKWKLPAAFSKKNWEKWEDVSFFV